VIAPEVRQGDSLVEILRLSSGEVVKVEVSFRGTIEAPHLELARFALSRCAACRSARSASGWRGA
jgi:hypothetical protein